MKYTLLLITLLCISFGSCSQDTKTSNPFAKNIKPIKTNKHQRVKGTRLYAIIPDNYKFIEELGRYQVSDNQFIQFIRTTNSWSDYRANLTREAFGVGVTIYQEVEISELEGLYVEGEDPKSNKNDIVLCFGNDEVTIMIVAKTTDDNSTGRTELIEILQSIIYDANYNLNEMEQANFTFDKSITNYTLSMSGNNLFMYSENGKEDVDNIFANSILFGKLPGMNSMQLDKYVKNMIERHETNGIEIENPTITKERIKSYNATILDTKIKLEGKEGWLYQVILENNGEILSFFGSGYNDLVKRRESYIRTVESIRWK